MDREGKEGTYAQRAAAVAWQARLAAAASGVDLHVEVEEARLSFMVERTTGAPGSGADAIRTLLALADAASLPVVLDVAGSNPRLVEYYWRFGFRLVDGDPETERRERDLVAASRLRALSRPDPDPGVVFMDRPIGAGPVLADEDSDKMHSPGLPLAKETCGHGRSPHR